MIHQNELIRTSLNISTRGWSFFYLFAKNGSLLCLPFVSANWIGGATMTGTGRWRHGYGVWPEFGATSSIHVIGFWQDRFQLRSGAIVGSGCPAYLMPGHLLERYWIRTFANEPLLEITIVVKKAVQ